MFPTEETYTYYVPPVTEGPHQKISKGKLLDKFRNSLRQLNVNGVKNSTKRALEFPAETNEESLGKLFNEDLIFLSCCHGCFLNDL